MTGDLISREALKKALKSNCDLCHDKNTNWCENCCPHNDFEDLIDNASCVARTDRPFVFIEGKVVYITQGHIDALVEYERNKGIKEFIDGFIDEFMKSLDQASETRDGGAES